MSQTDLAKLLGIPIATLNTWEKGKGEPSLDRLIKLSLFFEVSIEYLLGLTEDPNPISKKVENYPWLQRTKPFPVYDSLSVRSINMISQNIHPIDWISVPIFIRGQYAIKIADDSMAPLLNNGDYAIVDPESPAQNGELVAGVVNGFAQVKQLFKVDNKSYVLMSKNPNYPLILVPGNTYVEILGKVTWILKRVG